MLTKGAEHAIDLVARRDQLLKQLSAVDDELNKLFGEMPLPHQETPATESGNGHGNGTMAARILSALAARPGRTLSVKMLTEVVGPSSMNSFRQTIWRLRNTGQIRRVARGRYRAVVAR